MSYFPHMKSIVRSVLLFALLLVPALAFAQVTFTQTVPGVSSNSSQVFSSGNFFAPFTGFGGVSGYGIGGVAATILYVINGVLVPVLFAVSFIVFLYGIARAYIFSVGDPEKVKEGHKIILWGLIAFAVMVSIWGLVNVVANTFGLQGSYAPPQPTSYSPFGPLPIR